MGGSAARRALHAIISDRADLGKDLDVAVLSQDLRIDQRVNGTGKSLATGAAATG
ncbi:MAG: hypothetical protein M3P91_00700 [Actinomycetota bacterium]|nr:hypothetical protein [Actinomycetota bacterium]